MTELVPLRRREDFYSLIVAAVVLAFVGQALIGASFVQTGVVPVIGWTMLAWNTVWLITLPLVTPTDVNFPVLHYVMPLVLGVRLSVNRWVLRGA